MIRRRHWAAASVTAIALHAVVFSMLAQELDQGAALSGQYGVEVELGMLGDLGGGAQASGEDSEPQRVLRHRPRRAPEAGQAPQPEPNPSLTGDRKPKDKFRQKKNPYVSQSQSLRKPQPRLQRSL